ncbi:hypothetical protein BDZ91DRAFT_456002 [Kalaharituber pfeilii]|nr:hypothetical protein BDZ91DRAFT_456002 [Kalaharituber pfeilii]
MPAGVTLEQIRGEVLALASKVDAPALDYCCLDILYIRQKGKAWKDDENRNNGLRIDVPTIGSVYQHAEREVRYLKSLGKQLAPTLDGMQWTQLDHRHWVRHAWTLQELSPTFRLLLMASAILVPTLPLFPASSC